MSEAKGSLTKESFVRAAFEIADDSGLGALTMRALGERMGVDPTAVYRHFPSRERLIDAMLDAVVQQAAESPNSGDSPRDRVMSVAVNIRRALRSHPHVAGALATATGDFPSGFTITRKMIAALRDLGLRDENLVRMYQTFEGYILGSCVFDTGGYPATFVIRQARYRLIGEPEFAEIATSPENVERVTEEAFIETIGILLDRCEHLVRH